MAIVFVSGYRYVMYNEIFDRIKFRQTAKT